MNTDQIVYVTDAPSITKLASDIMQHREAENAGRATYLRSLLAALQIDLHGKVVLRAVRGDKRPGVEESIEAFERIAKTFNDAVNAALPENLSPLERNNRTTFARTAASTLRRALRLGWNALTPLPGVTKYNLTQWSVAHAPEPEPDLGRTQRRASRYVKRIAALVANLDENEAATVLQQVMAELSSLGNGAPATRPERRISGMRVQRVPASH